MNILMMQEADFPYVTLITTYETRNVRI